MKKNILSAAAILILTTLGLAGCKSVAEVSVRDTRRELSRAGFKKLEADTPEKLDHLKTLPQLVVTKRYRDGELFYFYADSIASKRLYVGKLDNYLRYSGGSSNMNRAEQNHQAAVNEAVDLRMVAGSAWGAWGPYRSWW